MTAALHNRFSAGQIAPFGQFAGFPTRENNCFERVSWLDRANLYSDRDQRAPDYLVVEEP